MRIFKLTNLVLDLIVALDSGTSHGITRDEVREHMDAGTIFEFLNERLGFSGAISVLEPVDRLELLLEWDVLRTRRDPCMYERCRSGLYILLDYLLEGIARRCESPNYRLTTEPCGPPRTQAN